MARKIVVTSGKGGVGKTTICANLGYRLAKFGFSVVVIDTDFGLNNLDVVMGVEKQVSYDIIDVIQNRCRVKQALINSKFSPSLFVLPAVHFCDKNKISVSDMNNVIKQLEESFDYILLDCPAGIDDGFNRAVSVANEALVVVTPHISSIRDADKVLSILANYNLTKKQLIVNRVRGDLVLNGEMIDVEDIIQFLRIPIVGIIPDDDDISAGSCNVGLLLEGGCERAFVLLAENIHTGSKKIYDYTMKYRGIWGGIRRTLKRKV